MAYLAPMYEFLKIKFYRRNIGANKIYLTFFMLDVNLLFHFVWSYCLTEYNNGSVIKDVTSVVGGEGGECCHFQNGIV